MTIYNLCALEFSEHMILKNLKKANWMFNPGKNQRNFFYEAIKGKRISIGGRDAKYLIRYLSGEDEKSKKIDGKDITIFLFACGFNKRDHDLLVRHHHEKLSQISYALLAGVLIENNAPFHFENLALPHLNYYKTADGKIYCKVKAFPRMVHRVSGAITNLPGYMETTFSLVEDGFKLESIETTAKYLDVILMQGKISITNNQIIHPKNFLDLLDPFKNLIFKPPVVVLNTQPNTGLSATATPLCKIKLLMWKHLRKALL